MAIDVKQHIERMVNVFDQLSGLGEDMKQLKATAKEEGHDPAKLAIIAKAISEGESGKLRMKLESTLDIMDKIED